MGSDKKSFTITPSSLLGFSTSYSVIVGSAVKNIAGYSVTGTTSFTFTTESSISLGIETSSSTSYSSAPAISIYPAFVDNMPYKAWKLTGSTDYYELKGRAGTLPYTWTVVSGALPTGLSLSSDGNLTAVAGTAGRRNRATRSIINSRSGFGRECHRLR